MEPAWVAPFVRGPPSSPVEVAKAPGPLPSVRRSLPVSSFHPPPPWSPTLSLHDALPVSFVATCTAEAPAELVASSTPVGDTRRIQGRKPADTGATSQIGRAQSELQSRGHDDCRRPPR